MMATIPATHRPALTMSIQVATRSRSLPREAQVRRWARSCLRSPALVTVRFVGAVEGAALNREYRGRNYPTNVLTFRYETKPMLAGDIVLCAPVVRREARAQKKSLTAHYAHLTVHGLLHLQGYDHEKPSQARVMENLEVAILSRLGYPDPYAAADDK